MLQPAQMMKAVSDRVQSDLGDQTGEIKMAVPKDGSSTLGKGRFQMLLALYLDGGAPAGGQMIAHDLERGFNFVGDKLMRNFRRRESEHPVADNLGHPGHDRFGVSGQDATRIVGRLAGDVVPRGFVRQP